MNEVINTGITEPETKPDKKAILIQVTDEQLEQIEFLKPIVKSKARTKVLIFCLKKTYDFFKDKN